MKITSIIISLSALFVWGAASTLNADNFVQDDDVEVSMQEDVIESPVQDGVVGGSPQDYFLGTARQDIVAESVVHDDVVDCPQHEYVTECCYTASCDERCCFDVCRRSVCNHSCCGWCPGFYAGLIGYGTSLKVEGESIGLSEYYGADDCNNKITGSMWGAVLGYSCCNPCGIYFNTEFEWAIGTVSGGEHYIDEFPDRDLTNYFWTTRVGYTFNCFDCYRITPYGGIGLWYSKQDISNPGLDVSYRDWFGILGGRIDRQFCDCLWVGINGQWYVPFSSKVKLEGYCGSISLDDHYGYQVDFPITYTTCWCNTPFTVTLAPFYRKMVDGSSDETTFDIETIQVPMLETRVYGAKLYIGYCF